MATNEDTIHVEPLALSETQLDEPPAKQRPIPGGVRFDWMATVVLGLLIGGTYLDGWAHNHGKVDNTFFTPWHAVLYAGLVLVGLFLGMNLLLNRRKGYPWRESLPPGYGISLFGVLVFGFGGVLDMVWHILFGIEVSVEALLSPTHLILGLGVVLMLTGPLRAAWLRRPTSSSTGGVALMPMVICVALLLSLFAFFTQYAHPQVSVYSGKNTPYATTNLPSTLSVMQANGTLQTRLISDNLNHWNPVWSHDGKRMAFAAGPSTNNTYSPTQIYVANADGSQQVRLTNDTFDDWAPNWSPDDSNIVFTSNRDGDYKLYEMNADGSHLVRLTPFSGLVSSWSPDGSKIVFNSRRDGPSQLYVMNADGSQVTRLTHTASDETAPAWSPDRSKIVFVSQRDGNSQIYLMRGDGTHQQALTSDSGGNWAPVWSPDGSKIAFLSFRDKTGQVYEMNADGSHQVNVSNDPGADNGIGGISWSRNGQLLYVVQEHPSVDPYFSQSLGVISILFQSTLLMSLVLFLLRYWSLPFGSMTVIFTLSSALISVLADQYIFIAAALAAGLIADVLLWRLKPSADRLVEFRICAFAVPTVFYSLYFLVVQLSGGINWSIHFWMGSIVLAGVIGLLLSYLLLPPFAGAQEGAESKRQE